MFNGMSETRRSRRLVISFFTTIGNYDYGFYWYLYLDGTIELEAKATGVVFTSALPDGESAYATEVAPGLGAPFHQHMFCARLDMSVDGDINAVDEIEAARVKRGPDNPHGNAFTRNVTRLRTESEGQREGDASVGIGHGAISNPDVHNRLGQPVAYVLHPQNAPLMLADTDSSTRPASDVCHQRISWVTRYQRDERYPAGEFVYQNHGGAGLPGSGFSRSRDRRRGHRLVAHVRAHPLSSPRGLAGDADGLRRVLAEGARLLRPQPDSVRRSLGWQWPLRDSQVPGVNCGQRASVSCAIRGVRDTRGRPVGDAQPACGP